MAVQLEAGTSINESGTTSVKMASEAAVVDMIKQGLGKGLWQYKKKEDSAAGNQTTKQ